MPQAATLEPDLSFAGMPNDRPETGHVLVVEPDGSLARQSVGLLRERGIEVARAGSAGAAIAFIGQVERLLDAIVVDLDLPDKSGMELLRDLQASGTDVPAVLVASEPSVQTAIEAVECRVHAFVTRPFETPDLADAVERAVRHSRVARMREEALALVSMAHAPQLEQQIDRALDTMWFAYQPIIDSNWAIVGYEALLRNEDPDLRNPMELIEAARRAGRHHELSQAIWKKAPTALDQLPPGQKLFMNVDPEQLALVRTLASTGPLASVADRVVLEVAESAARGTSSELEHDVGALKSLGFTLAVDDLGAAYSGLFAFTQLDPEYVKLDGALIRNLNANDRRRRLIASLIGLCREMGIIVVAEGVETRLEFEALHDLGCDLFQGFFVGRPDSRVGG